MYSRYTHIIGHLPFVGLFILIFVINQFVYMYSDDFIYSTYLGLSDQFYGQELTFMNTIKTQIYDYTYMNGRFMTNVLSILVLIQGIEVWRILNPILVTFLAYSIFYVVYVRFPKREDVWSSLLISLLFLLLHPHIFKKTVNYAIGSFNYVYPMLFLFILIAFFRRWDVGRPVTSWVAWGSVAMIGILAGMSQEQIAVLSIGFLIVWFLKELMQSRPFYKGHGLIAGLTLVGCAVLLLAPGPRNRSAATDLDFYSNLSLLEQLQYTFPKVMKFFFILQQPVYFLLLLVFLSILCFQKTRKWVFLLGVVGAVPLGVTFYATFYDMKFLFKYLENPWLVSLYGIFIIVAILMMSVYLAKRERNYLYIILALGTLTANLVMIFTPSVAGGRVAFPAIPLAIALIVLLFHQMKGRWLKVSLLLCIAGFSIYNYSLEYEGYRANAKVLEERIQIMEKHRGMTEGVIELPPLVSKQYAATEINDLGGTMRAFKDYYEISRNVKIVIKKQ